MSSKEFVAFTLLVTVSVGLISWFADPIWRVLAIFVAAALIVRAGPRFLVAAKADDLDAPLRADVLALLDDLAHHSQSESQASNAELDRVKILLQHAIDELVQRFSEMNTHIQAQRDLALSIASALAAGHADTDGISFADFVRDAAKKIETLLDNTINTSQLALALGATLDSVDAKVNATAGILGRLEALSRQTDQLARHAAGDAAPAAAADEAHALAQRSDQFAQEIRGHMNGVHAELAAARQAIAAVASFDRSGALQAKQRMHSTINRIGEINQTMGATAQRIEDSANHVAVGVNAAVTAMQFQDMTSQLIGHVQLRQSYVAELAKQLADSVRQHAQLRGGLSQARTWLRDLKLREAQCSHPVKQQHMGSGEIELF